MRKTKKLIASAAAVVMSTMFMTVTAYADVAGAAHGQLQRHRSRMS